MAVGIYVLHLHPGEEEIRRTFLREAAECVDPVRCKKVQRLKSTGEVGVQWRNVHLLTGQAVHAVRDGDIAYIVFWEKDFDIASSFDIVPTKSG